MLLVSTTRIIPGRAVPSFLSGRYPAVKVRKKLYVTVVSLAGIETAAFALAALWVVVTLIALAIRSMRSLDDEEILNRDAA